GNKIEVDSDVSLEGSTVLYHVFNKYTEAHCSFISKTGESRYLLEVSLVKIALDERRHPRATVEEGQVVINNIRAARNTINASLFNIPTSVKVHFGQYEQKLAGMADEVHVKVFDTSDDKLELVRKSQKILYLPDTQDIASYIPEDLDTFVDYRAALGTDIGQVMDAYRKARIKSELIVPVIYLGHDGKPIPLGYIQLISKSEPIGMDKIMELKAISFELVDRIRDSNTMLINKRQPVINVSFEGLQILIQDEELQRFLIHQKGMSFDIVFKLQQPITVFTEIIYTGQLENGSLLIGVHIMGRSSRAGEMERYKEMVETMLTPGASTSR
ncbi:MAG: DUF1577 domain-containing protein, partial [Candidatus Hydrogenedentota bacterium]